jgi:hypothetical protein
VRRAREDGLKCELSFMGEFRLIIFYWQVPKVWATPLNALELHRF